MRVLDDICSWQADLPADMGQLAEGESKGSSTSTTVLNRHKLVSGDDQLTAVYQLEVSHPGLEGRNPGPAGRPLRRLRQGRRLRGGSHSQVRRLHE